jgi:hypothetical protein
MICINPLKPKERDKKDSTGIEVKRKHLEGGRGGSERRFISEEGKKQHLVRRYPGNVRLSL